MIAVCFLGACLGQTVALTFDDLPLGGAGDRTEAVRANEKILAGLRRAQVQTTAFVIESRVQSLDGADIIRKWSEAGHELANHSYSHPNYNDLSVEEFQKQIVDGERTIGKVRYFRFPMNHTGDTAEKRDAMAAFLKQRGYTMAPCTIENVDYMFARVYRTLKGFEAEKLRREYVEFTSRIIDYYADVQRKALQREGPHVMLLHANALNGDTIDSLLGLFSQKGFRFVKLEQALSDPAYQKPDTFVTPHGPMWGLRWARERNIVIDERQEPDVPTWIQKLFRVLQNQ